MENQKAMRDLERYPDQNPNVVIFDEHGVIYGRKLLRQAVETGQGIQAFTPNLLWERLALTQAQIDQYNLPMIEKHDRRFKDGGAHLAVETEALSQRIIVEILRSRLDEFLPEPLASVQERAARERAIIQRALERL